MAFGIEVVNDDSIIQIDGTYPVLQCFSSGEGVGANVDVYFSAPCTTAAPPWLFLRGGAGYFLGVRFLGSSGNWLGFRMHASASISFNHGLAGRNYGSWDYLAGEFVIKPVTEAYGVRVWSAASQLTWDASVKVIKLKHAFRAWTMAGASYVQTLPNHASMANPENYLLVNDFACERMFSIGGEYYLQRKVGGFGTEQLVMRFTYGGNYSPPASFIVPGVIGSLSN